MLSIGFVVPTWHYFANPFKLQPLNELYFATIIDSHFKNNEVSINVIDLRNVRLKENKLDVSLVCSDIPEHDIYFYWIAKTADSVEIQSIAKYLRNMYPASRHAAGGTHVDNFPEECASYFDAIVLGPGEESFIEIINDIRNGSLKKIYRDDWNLRRYDDYPFPKRHYLPEKSIVNTVLFEKYGGVQGSSAMFSRGCDFRCGYCVYNVPSSIQRKSPKSVEEEIRYLKNEYGINGVNLRDEICVPLSSKVAIPFLEAIGRTDVIWRGQTKIGASKEVIALARESGCVELAIGVESASQQVLDIVNKKQTVNKAKEFIHICKSLGIKVKMCLILGLPGEPPDIANLTRLLIKETMPDYVNISGFCPVPGSDIFENPGKYGIKYIDNDWSKHAHLLFRFSDEEHFGLPFEYDETGKWGRNLSRSEIINNIKELQHYLREQGVSY